MKKMIASMAGTAIITFLLLRRKKAENQRCEEIFKKMLKAESCPGAKVALKKLEDQL